MPDNRAEKETEKETGKQHRKGEATRTDRVVALETLDIFESIVRMPNLEYGAQD